MLNIYDNMSAAEFADELRRVVDKTGDALSEHVDLRVVGSPSEYLPQEIVPASAICEYIPSLQLFLSYGLANASPYTDGARAMLNIAFGKDVEDKIVNLGLQLYTYATLMGDANNYTDETATALKSCRNIDEILNSGISYADLMSAASVQNIILSSGYASTKLSSMP